MARHDPKGRALMMAGLAVTLLGVLGCQAKPAAEPLEQTGPDAGRSAATGRDTEVEPVTDPFGPETAARLQEADLQEENLAASGQDEAWAEGHLEAVYFEFDRASLTEDSRAALERNATFLRTNSRIRVRIEGHCDERGTVEYNLALGDRRAATVRDFLEELGITGSRMDVVSFGEERPADPGHGETSWARNRRAEFDVR